MSDVTRILSQIEHGDQAAAEQLLPLVYDELRRMAAQKMAQEQPGQTLQATALVHEAYLRLVDVEKAQQWDSRGHFFAAAAEAMRRILVNRARDKGRLKRGGKLRRMTLNTDSIIINSPPDEILGLDEALRKLAAQDERSAAVVQLRFFGGLSPEETAQVLGISRRTVDRHWAFARAWLYNELRIDDDSARNP